MIKLLEFEEPKKFIKLLFFNISESINNKSSKTEYNELSTEENKLENRLLIVWVIVCTIFIPLSSKKTPLF